MLNVILALAKAFALVAAVAYLLAVLARSHKSKVPPCDTCEHCTQVDVRDKKRVWHCCRDGWTYHTDNSLTYCRFYKARDAPDSSEDTKEVSES